jgi:hypothetical protein
MRGSDLLGFNWLLTQGYSKKDIKYMGAKSPDFICSDGKRYEAKGFLNGGITFTKKQELELELNDVILVFEKNISNPKHVFLWKDRNEQRIRMIYTMAFNKNVSLPYEHYDFLKRHPEIGFSELVQEAVERKMKEVESKKSKEK